MKMLICNVGSSSFKFSLFRVQDESLLCEGKIDWSTETTRLVYRHQGQEIHERLTLRQHSEAVEYILHLLQSGASAPLQEFKELQAVGHRVVHGGAHYTAAVPITPEVKRVIGELADLAPLHNPPALDGINAVERALPGIPQIAGFDTAFHTTLSEAARTYPIPQKWTREWGIRRYGFHGLSHSYCAQRAAELTGRRDLRIVIAHLGNGASMSAVRNGSCVDTSMGFTPLEGLMMGSRSGSVDPGILIYLLQQKGLNANELNNALNRESGLRGVSGVSSDMREILSAFPHNADARLAVEVYVHRIRQTIGAMAATLGGIDALVFTAGVGENAPRIRELACQNLDFLGLELDPELNQACSPDADIATPDSAVRVLVIATREDLALMREARQLLESPAGLPGTSKRIRQFQ